ncbi:sigma-70 family RNA polymerase sigma factor [Paenibacillus thiaminolyticus]|uniref:sigma-70 family RNA polymerase sigma factor n=1 Tax=Paenibacillus thiaminolyticus TaxID=49283 RepID=UPI0013F66FC6|nr:sigma-70 family RNA polymerase sigma factor [Paenibacillus thiaminolyticus]NGP60074.1 sigma-70 family RNA polymerase sigma factor [Paenibacillus thiaminolyticus]
MKDLIPEYKDTRKALVHKRDELKQMRDELKERRLKLMGKITQPTIPHAEAEKIAAEIAALESDMSFLSAMISDREYDIEWMETGRRPGNKRGIERRAAYQRERPVDPLKLQAYIAKTSAGGTVQADRITDRERERIDFALGQLSPREREVYSMVEGNGMSYAEVAEILGIHRGSVQSFLEEAREKMRYHSKQVDLFDML